MNEKNVIINGVGGQGILTLLDLLANAAMLQGYEVKTAEVHGLSQRYGALETHLRFGEKINSSLVMEGDADSIISLEPLEALRVVKYASEKTVYLINTFKIAPISLTIEMKKYPELSFIEERLKRFTSNIIWIDASNKVKEITGNTIATNIYMAGFAIGYGLLEISPENFENAIKERFAGKDTIIGQNLNVFRRGVEDGKSKRG